ncbi:hypothetical protein C366_07006 [Cryptococcus neoformans Tu401-1]|nr:hypothetical protein C365_07056 [Cryptococcus neoformans var. grubii Bt85]OXG10075.1 hypothetical protein C366_07006 [Cryptococcus neoformans var. grubii Tu401-1]
MISIKVSRISRRLSSSALKLALVPAWNGLGLIFPIFPSSPVLSSCLGPTRVTFLTIPFGKPSTLTPRNSRSWPSMVRPVPSSASQSSMDGPRALRVPRGSGEGLKTRCRAIPQMRISVEQLHVESTDCVETNSQDEKTVEDMRWLAELNAKQNPSAMLTNLGVSPSNPVTGSTRGRSPKCTTLTSVPVSTPFAPAYSYDFTIREG